jgi:hypothetical protein
MAFAMRQNILLILGIAFVHFCASVAAFLWGYVVSSAAFDGRPISWLSRALAGPLHEALWFPFGRLLVPHASSGLSLYAGLLANSTFCAAAFLLLWVFGRSFYGKSSTEPSLKPTFLGKLRSAPRLRQGKKWT